MGGKCVHVLMVTLPPQGHINPVLRFAKRLVSKGIHVTLATTEDARHRLMSSLNVSAAENGGTSPRIYLEFFEDGLDPDMDRNKHLDILLLDSLPHKGSRNLSNLVNNLADNGRKFSCVIYQPFVPWAADVASEHGIPCAMLYIQAFAVYATYFHHHAKTRNGALSHLENASLGLDVPGLPHLHENDLPTFILSFCPYHFRKLIFDSVRSLEKVKWVLGNSFYELEKDVVQSMASSKPILLPVGPVVPSGLLGKEEAVAGRVDMWEAEDSCLEWLDKQSPSSVIYIAFGSITMLEPKQIHNIAMALKNTDRPFLWVVKPPERGFLEETNGKGLVVGWSPQDKVLMHPAVACFMTHCGWNSTLEAVVAGVPLLAFPGWTDQPTNAKLIADVFKIGLRMKPGENGVVSQEELEKCISEITQGTRADEIKKYSAELKAAAIKAVAEGGSSDKNLVRFISDITLDESSEAPQPIVMAIEANI